MRAPARRLAAPAVATAICWLAATAGAAVAGDCYSSRGCVQKAKSAKSFTDSVGVNVRLGYSDTIYYRNWPLVKERLRQLRVSHVRDGTYPAGYPQAVGPTVAARYNELLAAGIRGTMLVGHEQSISDGPPTTLAQRLAWLRANVPAFTIAVEGSNEWDTHGGEPSRVQALRDMQCDIYRQVKSDPVLASRVVVGPSSGNFYEDRIWYAEIGDLSACLDRGNLHAYAGEDPPHRRLSRDLSVAMDWARTTYGSKRLWATETGYWNVVAERGISERAAATYVPRTFAEFFRRGIERTQLYELIDLQTGSGRPIDNYGLVRSDGSPKPAFTALARTMSILADRRAARGVLRFGMTPSRRSTAEPIRHLLLKHSSGAFLLVVWSETDVWDEVAKRDAPTPQRRFRLHLRRAPAKVEVFDPAIRRSPVRRYRRPGRVIATVARDGVRIIKITPRRQRR